MVRAASACRCAAHARAYRDRATARERAKAWGDRSACHPASTVRTVRGAVGRTDASTRRRLATLGRDVINPIRARGPREAYVTDPASMLSHRRAHAYSLSDGGDPRCRAFGSAITVVQFLYNGHARVVTLCFAQYSNSRYRAAHPPRRPRRLALGVAVRHGRSRADVVATELLPSPTPGLQGIRSQTGAMAWARRSWRCFPPPRRAPTPRPGNCRDWVRTFSSPHVAPRCGPPAPTDRRGCRSGSAAHERVSVEARLSAAADFTAPYGLWLAVGLAGIPSLAAVLSCGRSRPIVLIKINPPTPNRRVLVLLHAWHSPAACGQIPTNHCYTRLSRATICRLLPTNLPVPSTDAHRPRILLDVAALAHRNRAGLP